MALEIQKARLKEIVVTDYIRACLDKVAIAQGFKNYDLIVDHGSSAGDGFVGTILTFTIKEKDSDKILTVLAKIPPASKARREQLKILNLFRRESFIYNVMLPEFVAFQKERKINLENGFFNFPKVYYANHDAEKNDGIIIMEDLRESGHKMWNKTDPINLEHAKLLIQSLARLHAVSFAVKAKKPDLFEKYKGLSDTFRESYMEGNFKVFVEGTIAKAVHVLDPNDEKKREKILQLIPYISGEIFDCVNPKHVEPYGVVVHGDCWINNLLFRYTKQGSPESIVLIDWQKTRYSSPVIDLVFFIFVCTDHEMRAKHYDELLNLYHHSLKELLDHMGGDTITQFPFTAFLRHLKKFGKYGVALACLMVPMLQTKNEDLMDIDFLIEKMNEQNPAVLEECMKQFMQKSSATEEGIKRMRDIFEDAFRYGYL